jgi:hypothetical protein
VLTVDKRVFKTEEVMIVILVQLTVKLRAKSVAGRGVWILKARCVTRSSTDTSIIL